MMKKAMGYLSVFGAALLASVNYVMFIFPNQFAPAGLNGIATIIQYLLHINAGYISLIVNIPLALVVYFKVNREMAVTSMIYVLTFSIGLLLLERIPVLDHFVYETENGTSTILGPLAAGIINGFCYSVAVRSGGSTGGTDFVATIIHKKSPDKDFFWIVFALNAAVAVLSYFVYDFKIEPVLLCIIYCFLTSTVGERVIKAGKSAVKFEIVTPTPADLSAEIIHKLGHTVTVMDGRGMYTGKETKVLFCVINRNQVTDLERIIQKYPGSFAYLSSVGEVVGNFMHVKRAHEFPEKNLDGK